MTSSFANVVGTPRDQLPDISKTNYLQTDADMTEATNNEIEKAKKDAEEFYNQMIRIRQLQQQNFDDNLQGLVNFSKSAATFVEAREAGREARERNEKRKDDLALHRKKFIDAEGKFKLRDAAFSVQLREDSKVNPDQFGKSASNLLKIRNADSVSD